MRIKTGNDFLGDSMPTNFADRLIETMIKKGSPVCVGLDPRIKNIPEHIRKRAVATYGNNREAVGAAFLEFNQGIIDATADLAPIVKPQMAFYEKYGAPGVRAFEATVRFAKSYGLEVLEDAKRNDIKETASAYADGHLGKVELCEGDVTEPSFDVDAMTVNGYLGSDGINPFVDVCRKFGKGIFILTKTSNKSAGELQDRKLHEDGKEGDEVYIAMVRNVQKWGEGTEGERGYRPIGMVVGATYPKDAERVRGLLPKAFKLVPGYGAQGSAADDVVPNFNEDGLGAIVNNSRGIIFAYTKGPHACKPEQYKGAAREATRDMRSAITKALTDAKKCAW